MLDEEDENKLKNMRIKKYAHTNLKKLKATEDFKEHTYSGIINDLAVDKLHKINKALTK